VEILLRQYYESIGSVLKDRFGILERAYHWCVLLGSTCTIIRGLDPLGTGILGPYGVTMASDQCLNVIIAGCAWTIWQVASICYYDIDQTLLSQRCCLPILPYCLALFWVSIETASLSTDIYLLLYHDFLVHGVVRLFYCVCSICGLILFHILGKEMKKVFASILPDYFKDPSSRNNSRSEDLSTALLSAAQDIEKNVKKEKKRKKTIKKTSS